jgi:uncharacterized protein (TIGR00369 family)
VTQTITPMHTPFLAGGPERLFRVGPVTQDRERVTGSMRTGAWMLSPGGEPCRGSLGVLADDLLGYAVIARGSPGLWGVSTEISVDFCAPLPVDGSTLYAESQTVEVDPVGGLARGRIVSRAGSTIAFSSQRVRFVPTPPPRQVRGEGAAAHHDSGPRTGPDSLLKQDPATTADLIGATTRRHDGGATVVLAGSLDVSNPMGSMHGGIALCASEIAGQTALQGSSPPLVTASIHVVYLRPVPLDGDVRFRATVLHRGRTLGVAQVVSHNSAGKACTVATVTCHQPLGICH